MSSPTTRGPPSAGPVQTAAAVAAAVRKDKAPGAATPKATTSKLLGGRLGSQEAVEGDRGERQSAREQHGASMSRTDRAQHQNSPPRLA